MFTRCPKCESVHALSAALLARASGRVRCGDCGHAYSALTSLFDDWPRSTNTPPAARFGSRPAELARATGEPDTPGEQPRAIQPGSNRSAWIVVVVVLFLVTLINLVWTFRQELARDPLVHEILLSTGMIEADPAPVFRDPALIHLVSRDLHQHPSLSGMLSMSATFVNRGARAQPYPDVELSLVDAGNSPVASRRFSPAEYLESGADPGGLLAPGVHVTILVEFVDPGPAATGFELNFR